MKFTVDTKIKTITLIDRVTFKEMDSLKKFIGDNWREWSIEALKVTEVQKEYINQWWLTWPYSYPAPCNPYAPIVAYGTGKTHYDHYSDVNGSTVNCMVSPDRSEFVVDVNGSLGSLTLADIIEP